MVYLGILCDCKRGIVSLDKERVQELQQKMAAIQIGDSLSVREVQSLIAVLVFCSVVIRLGRVHYNALIDVVAALGPHPRPRRATQIAS